MINVLRRIVVALTFSLVGVLASASMVSVQGMGHPYAGIPLTQPPLAPPLSVSLVTDPAVATIVPIVPINVNIRAGSSTEHHVMARVAPGTQVTVLGQDATNLWLFVRLQDGKEGWVARYLTNFIGAMPVVTAPPVTALPPAPPAPAVTEPPPPQAVSGVDQGNTLASGDTAWYDFRYAGRLQPMHIRLDVVPLSGARFGVYGPEPGTHRLGGVTYQDVLAFGEGNPRPEFTGYMYWTGAFSQTGVYRVKLENSTPGALSYRLTISASD